jgi:cytochrome c oxidase subunit IV
MKPQTRMAAVSPYTAAWLVLVAATGIGWWFGHLERGGPSGGQWAMVGVIVTAFAKAWIVGFQFMELKHAPRWLRHAYDAWIVLVCGAVVVICLG